MKHRMLAEAIIRNDNFVLMSTGAQALYLQLVFAADNAGLVDATKSISRMIGAADDATDELKKNGYLIDFPGSTVVAIKHWRIHNANSKADASQTTHVDEYHQLRLKENGAYANDSDAPYVSEIDKKLAVGAEFPPTLDTVKLYAQQSGLKAGVAENFFDYYSKCEWKTKAGYKLKNWQNLIRKWRVKKQ